MTKYIVQANLTIADQTKLGFQFESKIVSNCFCAKASKIALYGTKPKLFDNVAKAQTFADGLRKSIFNGQKITLAWFEVVEYKESK